MNTILNVCYVIMGLGFAILCWRQISIGSRSILLGVHCFFLHPIFVAIGWWRLYGFPYDPRLWVAFVVHDWGYWGKPNMDGPEGEQHPELGARIMHALFDFGNVYLARSEGNADLWSERSSIYDSTYWYRFTRYHSRFLAKQNRTRVSPLCAADKMAFVIEPRWLYLFRSNLSGEIHEYMCGQGCRTPAMERNQWQWLTQCQAYVRSWIFEHKDGKEDHWTGTVRDHARQVEETQC